MMTADDGNGDRPMDINGGDGDPNHSSKDSPTICRNRLGNQKSKRRRRSKTAL
jgi:hypothetical protein